MKDLEYIYTGTGDFNSDQKFYMEILQARLVWEFQHFGVKVAAFDISGKKPWVLLADHKPPGYRRLIYSTKSLTTERTFLSKKGLKFTSGIFNIPDGPCINFEDKSGNKYALIEKQKPDNYLIDEYLKQQKENS